MFITRFRTSQSLSRASSKFQSSISFQFQRTCSKQTPARSQTTKPTTQKSSTTPDASSATSEAEAELLTKRRNDEVIFSTLAETLKNTVKTTSLGKNPKHLSNIDVLFKTLFPISSTPIRVAVTGASGQIGYALVFRIASGQMFGNRPVILQLIELPAAMKGLQGVVMELKDCAFPLVKDIIATDDLAKGFENTDWALLVGAKPRSKGMERGDLILANAEIFSVQGKALNQYANKNVKVVVVGNPANTNALIAQSNAPNIPPENFTALTRLDHNRGLAQIVDYVSAENKKAISVDDISQFGIWGNHSATQFPDLSHTKISGTPIDQVVDISKWNTGVFIPAVQQRGAEIIAARGSSSAASAASSVVDHVRDWINGVEDWTSMAVYSKGEYGVKPGLIYSYPVTISNENFNIVPGLKISSFAESKLKVTHDELIKERDTVAHLLTKK